MTVVVTVSSVVDRTVLTTVVVAVTVLGAFTTVAAPPLSDPQATHSTAAASTHRRARRRFTGSIIADASRRGRVSPSIGDHEHRIGGRSEGPDVTVTARSTANVRAWMVAAAGSPWP